MKHSLPGWALNKQLGQCHRVRLKVAWRSRKTYKLVSNPRENGDPWIPAFAGMTMKGIRLGRRMHSIFTSSFCLFRMLTHLAIN
jgi:hypothetical protein